MMTLTTVGYGDYSPVTPGGQMAVVVLSVIGPLYLAMPIGIVGRAFSDIWEDRQRLLLLQEMRNRVVNAGYTPTDIRRMFLLLDEDGSGTMDTEEFQNMLEVMQMQIDPKFVSQVFSSFEADEEGCIEFNDLLKGLFPSGFNTQVDEEEEGGGDDLPLPVLPVQPEGGEQEQDSEEP
jgi:hypothetical protein